MKMNQGERTQRNSQFNTGIKKNRKRGGESSRRECEAADNMNLKEKELHSLKCNSCIWFKMQANCPSMYEKQAYLRIFLFFFNSRAESFILFRHSK